MKKSISQSLIRDLLSPLGYCGHYINEVYNNGFKTEPTPSMLEGLVFEQAILGKTADGTVYEMPKSRAKGKEGTMLQREIELLKVIEFAKGVLKENEIEFSDVQLAIEIDGRNGRIDAKGTYKGVPYLFDLKYTGMTYKDWARELKWGDTTAHFRIQGLQYQSLSADKLPFMFLVFGDDWSRFFEMAYDDEAVEHQKEVAREALEAFNEMDFRPTGDSRLCFDCRMKSICTVKNQQIQIEQL